MTKPIIGSIGFTLVTISLIGVDKGHPFVACWALAMSGCFLIQILQVIE